MEIMSSQVLYTVIVLYSIITGLYLSYYQIKCIKKEHPAKLGKRLIIVSFPLLLVLVLNDSCTDFYSYVRIFNMSSFESLYTTDAEIGWTALNALLKLITADGVIAINILRGLTFTLFGLAIYKMQRFVDVGWSWIAFVCMGYFNILSMVAFMMAVAFVLLACTNLIVKKYKPMLFELALGVLMHYTAVIPVAMFILFFVCYGYSYTRKLFVAIAVGGAIIIAMLSRYIFVVVANTIPFLNKYLGYGLYSSSGTGLRQFAYYFPIFVCLYFAARNSKNRVMTFSSIIALVGFTVGICSYSINNLKRAYLYFIFLFIAFFPALILNQETYKWRGNVFANDEAGTEKIGIIPFTSGSFKFLVLVYLVYRVINLLSSEWPTLYSSGFSEFHFLF